MSLKAIAINKLLPSPKNVRKIKPNKESDAELVASIRLQGLMQNLVVEASTKQKGMYEVVAGERRRQSLLQLVKEKHLKANDTVECRVIDADNAEEASYTENTTRLNMHPADEFEAFTRLMNVSGLTIEQVAERYGTTVRHVKQRLFAFCASGLIHVNLFSSATDDDTDTNNDLTEMVIKLLGIKWHEYWRPTAENFYNDLTKDKLAALGAQFHADPDNDWKVTVSKCNKSQLVAKVEELINHKAPHWMPEGFETK